MHIVCLGRRYQGKTTLAYILARSQHPNIIVWDSNAQFEKFADFKTSDLDAMGAWFEENTGVVSYIPPDELGSTGDLDEAFDSFADFIWGWKDFSLIVDEASTIQRPSVIPRGLSRLVRRKTDDVTLIQTTHRYVDLQTTARALITHLFVFQTTTEADLEKIGDDWGRVGLDVAAIAQTLPRHVCVHAWLDAKSGKQLYSVWERPAEWYVDLGNVNRDRA